MCLIYIKHKFYIKSTSSCAQNFIKIEGSFFFINYFYKSLLSLSPRNNYLNVTITIGNQKIDIVFFISILQNCLEHFEIKENALKYFKEYKSFVKSFEKKKNTFRFE